MNKNPSKFSLILTVFVDMVGFSILFPIFPNLLKWFLENDKDSFSIQALLKIPEYFGLSNSNPYYFVLIGGIVGSLYSFLQFIFSPVWGRLSDQIGRKKILTLTTIGSVFSYALWIFSDSFNLFVISRIISGTMGGNISVASASMADLSSEKDRAKSMGLIGAGIGLGFIFGPPIGGLLASLNLNHELNNSYPFLTYYPLAAIGSLTLALINLFLILFYYQETLITKSEKKDFTHPVLDLKNSNLKELPLICFIYFIYTFAFSGFEFSFNFYLNLFFNLNQLQIGYVFVYLGLLIVFVQGGLIRRLSGKVSNLKLVNYGIILLVIGFSMLYFSKNFYFSMFSLIFTAFGSAFLNPSISAITSIFSSTTEQGKNLGIMRGFGSLARAIAPFSFGFIYFTLGHEKVFLISGILILGILFLTNKLKKV